MSEPSTLFRQAVAEIDRKNAEDPRLEMCTGVLRPREIVYAERLSECLAGLYPNASELLRLAARGQHICRWQIARTEYPMGREGYNAWRAACRDHHVALMTAIMRDCGYEDGDIARVSKLIRKQDLKLDPESQALENAVGVTFVEHYLADFVSSHPDYDEAKLLGILRKTMRKLDRTGHAAIRALSLSEPLERLAVASLPSSHQT